MFSSSTQKTHWLFSRAELVQKRIEVNRNFVETAMQHHGDAELVQFLTADEERIICRVVEETAQKFCQTFKPSMPFSVTAHALMYFKRFFLRNSVMEHLAKNVMMGCMYLACKIDEFNVSIDEFVKNLKSGTPTDNLETILAYELSIMHNIDYQLTIHTPIRPLEGILIDMKTYYTDKVQKVESLRETCVLFLWKCLVSDVIIMYPPSQIAFASVWHSCVQNEFDLDEYFDFRIDEEHRESLKSAMQSIIDAVTSESAVPAEIAKEKMKKLADIVKWISNHPISLKRKLEDDEDDDSNEKIAKLAAP